MSRGRPKGYSPYTEITYGELGDWVGRKSLVKVSRTWLEELTGEPTPPPAFVGESPSLPLEEQKIEFNLIDLNDE